MGLMCAKLRPCCCCYCCEDTPTAQATAEFKVLLLGATGSGKTQLGHLLSQRQRDPDDLAATNGVRCYRVKASSDTELPFASTSPPSACSNLLLLLTEVGGSVDLQRIWPHYYASCHALIFCFDLSGSDAHLQDNFALLQRCLQHESLRGKPVLLVATQHREGVQLYDVEYAFGLEQLAKDCGSPLHICYMAAEAELQRGLDWLRRQLYEQAALLAQRINYDVNLQVSEREREGDIHLPYSDLSLSPICLQSWQQRRRDLLSSGKLAQVHRQRFRRRHRKVTAILLSHPVLYRIFFCILSVIPSLCLPFFRFSPSYSLLLSILLSDTLFNSSGPCPMLLTSCSRGPAQRQPPSFFCAGCSRHRLENCLKTFRKVPTKYIFFFIN